MNRKSFLKGLFKGVIVATAAPQIITHGLKLKRIVVPVYDPYGFHSFRFPVIKQLIATDQHTIKEIFQIQPFMEPQANLFYLDYATKSINPNFYRTVTIENPIRTESRSLGRALEEAVTSIRRSLLRSY